MQRPCEDRAPLMHWIAERSKQNDGNFQKVFIFEYYEEALLFENKFPRPVVFRK